MMATLTFAQKQLYQVVAQAPRTMNLKGEPFGKATLSSIKIIKQGDSRITIGDSIYSVVSIDSRENNDSITSVQYTVQSPAGDQCIVKFIDDNYPQTELMRHTVIFLYMALPYDWTYYFTEKPRDIQ